MHRLLLWLLVPVRAVGGFAVGYLPVWLVAYLVAGLFLAPKAQFEHLAEPVRQWAPLLAGAACAVLAVLSGGGLFGVVADRLRHAATDRGDESADGWTWPRWF